MVTLPREMMLWKIVGMLLQALLVMLYSILVLISLTQMLTSATSLCTLKSLNVMLVLPCHNLLSTFYSAFFL